MSSNIPDMGYNLDIKTDDFKKYKELFGTEPDSDSLGNLIRLAGGIGDLFGGSRGGTNMKDLEEKMKKTAEILRDQADETEAKIDDRLEAVYPGLTGMTGQDAIKQYYGDFSQNVQDFTAQGRADLDRNPDVSPQFEQSMRDIKRVQDQFSLAEQLGGYPKIALDPQVVKTDTKYLKDIMGDVGDAIEAQGSMDYMKRPETAYLIQGIQADRAAAIADFLSNSKPMSDLMNYGNVG
tara:strand:- start:71 stop:778 length:708 start_codon:yes stop_codon:yes gene_type:complete